MCTSHKFRRSDIFDILGNVLGTLNIALVVFWIDSKKIF